jgi:hypothetical protein
MMTRIGGHRSENLAPPVLVVVCLMASGATAYFQAQSAPELSSATAAFLASLTAAQRARIQFGFDSEEWFNWNYVLREHYRAAHGQ